MDKWISYCVLNKKYLSLQYRTVHISVIQPMSVPLTHTLMPLFSNGCRTKLAPRVMKRQAPLPSLLWTDFTLGLIYPLLVLKITSASISFPLGKMLEWEFWDTDRLPTEVQWRIQLSYISLLTSHIDIL